MQKKAKPTKPHVFDNLVDNAFDFLDKAGKELEKEPKYSVIHFYAALELFLKARLLHEHWTLVLTKPESADLDAFRQGNFHSVTLKDAQQRLKSVIQQGLTDEEFKCFEELGNHRNRMVHFFHHGQLENKTSIEKIVSQQCRAWFYLHRVLTQKWSSVFSEYRTKIATYDKRMHKQRQFLAAKFEEIKTNIGHAKSKGGIFHDCPSCGYQALEEFADDLPVLEFCCRVCEYETSGVRMECACGAKQALIDDAHQICLSCQHRFSAEEVKNSLLNDHVGTKDNFEDLHEASCGECQSHLSVALLPNDEWMCSNCFARFEWADLGHCEWCHELTSEDVEDSYFSGCEHCDGHSGWHKDD